MSATNPISEGSGTLTVPIATFEAWANSFQPKTAYYAYDPPTVDGENLVLNYNMSTDEMPDPPTPPGP